MNRDEYLNNLEIKNRRLLLKIYEREIKKLKIKIYEATQKGNDTVYLQKLHDEVEQEIKVFKSALKKYSVKSATDSYKGGAKLALLGISANEVVNKFEFGKVNRQAIMVLAQTTYKPLSKMAQHIGRATLEYMQRDNFKTTQTVLSALNKTFGRKFAENEFLRKTGIEGVADVVVGSASWQKAARDIRDKIIAGADYNVPYYNKKGDLHRWVSAKDYSKMVSRTTTANIAREGAKDSILDTFDGEFDLVEIIGHSVFPNSPCIPYEGNILSLEGIVKGYTTVAEAEAKGLFHPNCIHSFGVTDAVMEIYRKDEYEINEGKEEKPEEEVKENVTTTESANNITDEILSQPYKNISQNDEVIAQMHKQLNSLAESEVKALTIYTKGQNGEYLAINGTLRGDLTKYKEHLKSWSAQKIPNMEQTVQGWIDNIDKAMANSKIPENIQLYRGGIDDSIGTIFKNQKLQEFILNNPVNEDNLKQVLSMVKNETFTEKAFMSTSYIKETSFKGNVRLKLNSPQNIKGLMLDANNIGYDKEKEVLLNRGYTWKVKNVYIETDNTTNNAQYIFNCYFVK